MSDTPPKVKEFFVLLGGAALFSAIYAVIKGGVPRINAVEWFCLGGIAIPILLVFILYKVLEKQRANKPAKETVQKLGLDD